MVMGISVTFKRKFTINGKDYNSIEEMPDDVRDKFKKIMGSLATQANSADPTLRQTKIVLNAGLGITETGTASHGIDRTEPKRDGRPELGSPGKDRTDFTSPPPKYETAFSARTLIVTGLLGALLILLYYLWQIRA
jgi:hypothetical protein